MHEKLTVFLYAQYVIGIDSSLAFGRYKVRGWYWGL